METAIKAVKEECELQHSEELIKKMYIFWVEKRKKKGKALYLKFQPIPKMDDPNPFCAFRPRESKKIRKV